MDENDDITVSTNLEKNMKPTKSNTTLSERVITLIEETRRKVAVSANIALVYTYYEIGRMIVEEEQGGKVRAEYGEKLLSELSEKLTDRFGKGWSIENLTRIRKFYLVYGEFEISSTVFTKSTFSEFVNTVDEIHPCQSSENRFLPNRPSFTLSWSHYLVLMRIADSVEQRRH